MNAMRVAVCGVVTAGMLVSMCGGPGPTSAGPARDAGAIEAVTVYRGQALVTRRIEVPATGPPGA